METVALRRWRSSSSTAWPARSGIRGDADLGRTRARDWMDDWAVESRAVSEQIKREPRNRGRLLDPTSKRPRNSLPVSNRSVRQPSNFRNSSLASGAGPERRSRAIEYCRTKRREKAEERGNDHAAAADSLPIRARAHLGRRRDPRRRELRLEPSRARLLQAGFPIPGGCSVPVEPLLRSSLERFRVNDARLCVLQTPRLLVKWALCRFDFAIEPAREKLFPQPNGPRLKP